MSDTTNNAGNTAAEPQTDAGGGQEYTEEGDLGIISSESKPRNTTAMLFLGFMLMGGGALYFMHLKTGPSTASANEETTKASETIAAFLKDDSKKAMNDLFHNTDRIVSQFLNYPNIPEVQVDQLQTNPFRMADAAPDKTAEIEAEKARKLAEQQKEEAIKSASALKLQAVLGGKVPKAMINNSMFKEGQEVEGFVIEKIGNNAVQVRKGPYKFELKMQ